MQTEVTRFVIICDKCGGKIEGNHMGELKSRTAAMGWAIGKKDYCPICNK